MSNDDLRNPYLRDGDVIIIDNNKLDKTTQFLRDSLSPVEPIVRAKVIFDLFED